VTVQLPAELVADAVAVIDLQSAHDAQVAAQARLEQRIGECRAAGVSWARIGQVLGVTAQSCHARYRRLELPGELGEG
jgi:hypothetical protein